VKKRKRLSVTGGEIKVVRKNSFTFTGDKQKNGLVPGGVGGGKKRIDSQ